MITLCFCANHVPGSHANNRIMSDNCSWESSSNEIAVLLVDICRTFERINWHREPVDKRDTICVAEGILLHALICSPPPSSNQNRGNVFRKKGVHPYSTFPETCPVGGSETARTARGGCFMMFFSFVRQEQWSWTCLFFIQLVWQKWSTIMFYLNKQTPQYTFSVGSCYHSSAIHIHFLLTLEFTDRPCELSVSIETIAY